MIIEGREVKEVQSGFDEESGVLTVTAYRRNRLKEAGYVLAILLSLGTLYILSRWYKKLEAAVRLSRCLPADSTHVLVEAYDGLLSLVSVQVKTVPPSAFGPSNVMTASDYKVSVRQVFVHRQEMFYLHQERLHWTPVRFPCLLSYRDLHNQFAKGIRDPAVAFARTQIYGLCLIDVPIPAITDILIEEVLNPFFLFQAFSVSLWLYEQYRLYAFIILAMTVFSITVAVMEIRRNAYKIKQIAQMANSAKALREYVNAGEPTELPSTELVPGDLIEILPNWKLPCDVILLNGSCVVNEGMLTGESTPVLKDALPNNAQNIYDPFRDKKYTISAGSIVLQVRRKTVGVVVATGFGTAKGRLVKSILYPKPNKFRFQQDSIKFVVALGVVALVGAALSIKTFIDDGVGAEATVVHSLDLITIAVPPALPIAMTVGITFAVTRLSKKGITCISPHAVNAAGRASIVCFDKTGTITEDSMGLVGVLTVENGEFKSFNEDLRKCSSTDLKDCLMCCQALALINGEVSGDPMERAIMNNLNFTLKEETERTVENAGRKFEVVQIYHFSSVTKRMGVVARSVTSGQHFLFSKGAPEEIRELCSHLPPSYNDVLFQYSKKGLRVLSCSYKPLDHFIGTEGMGEIEGGMAFLGLVVLQNKLKMESFGVIKTLKSAGIGMVIATGDNVMTGVAVAREAELIPADLDVYCCELAKDHQTLLWEKHNFTDSELLTPDRSFEWLTRLREHDTYLGLAFSGRAFEQIVRSCRASNHNLLRFVLENLVVCGRMSPSQKSLLVEELQSQGHLVVMCGDGANDCGALKSADVGMSVSTEEASVAAPFTALSLLGLEDILREGRAALTTSFQCFKFIGLYSMIQFVSVATLFLLKSTLMDGQFLYIDLFTIIPLTFVMSNTPAYPVLVRQKPPGSLLSVPVLVSMLGLSVIQLLLVGTTVLALVTQPWYEPGGNGVADPEPCYENSAIFLVSSAQYVSVCVAFSIGPPFRVSAWRNWMFSVTASAIVAFDLYMVLFPSDFVREVIGLEDFPGSFRALLLLLMLLGCAITLAFEKFIVARLEQCADRFQESIAVRERNEDLSKCEEGV